MIVFALSILVPLAITAIICSDTLAQRKAKIKQLEESRDLWQSAWIERGRQCAKAEAFTGTLVADLIAEKQAHLVAGNELAQLVDQHKQVTEELAQLKASIATEAARKRPLWRALADRIAQGDTQ